MPQSSTTVSQGALLGGAEYAGTDGRRFCVRALPVRKFPDFAAALVSGEPALVALFAGLTDAEVDALPIDDFEKILEIGTELNLAPFSRWSRRQAQTAQLLGKIFPPEAPAATLGANGASSSQSLSA